MISLGSIPDQSKHAFVAHLRLGYPLGRLIIALGSILDSLNHTFVAHLRFGSIYQPMTNLASILDQPNHVFVAHLRLGYPLDRPMTGLCTVFG